MEEVQQAQQAFAATSGLGRGARDDLDLEARLEALGQDLDDVRGITHRLERYVEQMLRQMLGSLNAGDSAQGMIAFAHKVDDQPGSLGCCVTPKPLQTGFADRA